SRLVFPRRPSCNPRWGGISPIAPCLAMFFLAPLEPFVNRLFVSTRQLRNTSTSISIHCCIPNITLTSIGSGDEKLPFYIGKHPYTRGSYPSLYILKSNVISFPLEFSLKDGFNLVGIRRYLFINRPSIKCGSH